MKKLDVVAINKVNTYFSKNSVSSLNIAILLQTLNSGKAKYDYFELLDYLITSSVSLLESNPSNLKKLDKYLTLIGQIASVSDGQYEHDEITISRYTALPEALKKYYADRDEELDQELYNYVIDTGKKLGVSFEENEQKDDRFSTRIIELADEVDRLKKANTDLTRTLNETLKQLQKANKTNEQLQGSLAGVSKDSLDRISALESQIKSLQEQIANLDNDNLTKNLKIKQLENLIKEKEQLVKDLTKRVDSITEDKDKIDANYHQVVASRPYVIGKNALIDEQIDAAVLNVICKKKHTASEIYEEIKSTIPFASIQDVYASLRRISCKFNIQNPKVVTVPEVYGITKPTLAEDKTLILPTDGNVKRVLLLSDIHIDPLTDLSYLYAKMNYLYSYAAKNGIDTLIDLGDLFDTDDKAFAGIQNPITAYNKVSEVSQMLSDASFFDPSFNYVVLGGNHDVTLASYGFDPFAILKDANPNVIPIGYNNASLKIGNDKLGLHHEGMPRQDAYSRKEFNQKVLTFLKNYYGGKERAFFDFFGHLHSSLIDSTNGYACVPSFDKDRTFDSLFELEIYLDKNNDIEYMVIYPLTTTFNKDVRRTTEIPILR